MRIIDFKTDIEYILPVCEHIFDFWIHFFLLWLSGIGRDLCERLDAIGATVYAISRSIEPLNELVASNPRIKSIQIDLSDWSIARAELEKHFKAVKIDGLVILNFVDFYHLY